MELRHLRYFIAVAEEGHVTRAASRLGIQQPPLSQQIKALERELDVQLLRRKARGIELTEAGRVYFESARAILGQLGHAAETSRRTARGEQGRICIGITPTSPFHPFLPRVIRAFRDTYPQVSVRLEEQLGSELLEQLRRRGVTLYLASGTDLKYVRHEAELLGLAPYFGEHVYGALDDHRNFSKKMIVERILSENGLRGEELLGFGDGFVEIEEVKRAGGVAVAVASDEVNRRGVNEWKRNRLVQAGADVVIPEYRRADALLQWLFGEG